MYSDLLPPRFKNRQVYSQLFLVSILVVFAGCSSLGAPITSGPNNTSTDTGSDSWIVVVPVEGQDITDNVSAVNADSDPFDELTALQQALTEANETGNQSAIGITERESRKFVDATKDVSRVPDNPGIIINYQGKYYRVYIMGLT